jgi:hypothetical protein
VVATEADGCVAHATVEKGRGTKGEQTNEYRNLTFGGFFQPRSQGTNGRAPPLAGSKHILFGEEAADTTNCGVGMSFCLENAISVLHRGKKSAIKSLRHPAAT